MRRFARIALSLLVAAPLGAQARELAPALKAYVTVNEPVVALTNARVVDGTGTPAKDGQTILIRGEKIAAVGPASSVTVPAGARTIDLAGKTVIPGIIGLHDHMYYGGMKFMGVELSAAVPVGRRHDHSHDRAASTRIRSSTSSASSDSTQDRRADHRRDRTVSAGRGVRVRRRCRRSPARESRGAWCSTGRRKA